MASIWDVADSFKTGALVRVLPDYGRSADIWAVSTARSTSSAKVRIAISLLKEQLQRGPFALKRFSEF
jgi:LysR family transcriptional regulator, transcriptional activator for dmlA